MPLAAFRNTFAGNPLDRASDRRPDAEWIAAQLASPESMAVAVCNGRPLLEDGPRLAYLPAPMAGKLAGGEERLLFLGLWEGAAVFAVDLEGDEADLSTRGVFHELRQTALALPPAEAAIAATARQMFEWRRRHRFCAACGEASRVADAGWKRVCPACQAEHFPRTDPVVIMVACHGERMMLGRQTAWAPGVFSALAGFLEPGESIEEACARELAEEAGLKTRSVRYHSTQPWPFPSSLMIGLIAEVEDDQAAPDQTELEAVRWFTRAEARALLAGELPGLSCPAAHAIAHHLIKAWAEGS